MALVAVGSLHYCLWGRSMSRQVESEREEDDLRELANDWPIEEHFQRRRF